MACIWCDRKAVECVCSEFSWGRWGEPLEVVKAINALWRGIEYVAWCSLVEQREKRIKALRAKRRSGVYFAMFVGDQSKVKIGFSEDICRREKQLPGQGPHDIRVVAVEPGATRERERELHQKFDKWRIHTEGGRRTEWFEYRNPIKQVVNSAVQRSTWDVTDFEGELMAATPAATEGGGEGFDDRMISDDPRAVAARDEIRAHVRGMSSEGRIAFARRAVVGSDHVAIAALIETMFGPEPLLPQAALVEAHRWLADEISRKRGEAT